MSKRRSVVKPRSDLERKVLKWCNDVRKGAGVSHMRGFRKGYRLEPYFCPLALTIGCNSEKKAGLATGTIKSYFGGEELKVPAFVRKFIDSFDSGKYPHLDIMEDSHG
jgi:hypothetical protein